MIQEAINRYLLRTKQNSLSPKAVLFDMDGVDVYKRQTLNSSKGCSTGFS